MKKRFNYLQHADAVNEILKHKWIESERAKRDIGFVTAAMDWIKKYGEAWKRIHNISDEKCDNSLIELAERRKYRRFKIDLPVKINAGGLKLDAQLKEINHIGANLLCKASLGVGNDIEIELETTLKEKGPFNIHFKSRVVKSAARKNPSSQNTEYFITTLFDKSTQSLIINNKKELFN